MQQAQQNNKDIQSTNTIALENWDTEEAPVPEAKNAPNPLLHFKVTDYEDYVDSRDKLIEEILAFWGNDIDRDTAVAMLEKSKFKNFEKTFQLWGRGSNTKALSDAQKSGLVGEGGMTEDELGTWFSSLSDADQLAARGIDYSQVTTYDELQAALEY